MIGYIVYAGTQSGQYTAEFNVGLGTSFLYGVVPDRAYYFTVASYAEGMRLGPLSGEVVGSAHATILLSNPGDQLGTTGSPTALQLSGIDSFGGAVTFSAAGQPPGLAVNSSTGLVAGTPATAGSYAVTVTASNGVSSVTQLFRWTILPPSADVTAPVVTITDPATLDRALTVSPAIAIGGVTADDNGVVQVMWSNDRGGSGIATGTNVWLAGVLLSSGRNDITITAVDQAGNRGVATISVYRQSLP